MSYYRNITDRVNKLVRTFDTRDPFEIAKGLGIVIIYSDRLKKLKGMYRVIKGVRFIILNNKNSRKMNMIVCAHELGHDQLHRIFAQDIALQEFMLYDMSTQQEYEANIFASCLLLDDANMLEYVQDGFDTVQIAQVTGTDINLVALKVDCMIRDGYNFRPQDHDSQFLR